MSEQTENQSALASLMAALAPEARIAAVDDRIMSARESFEVPSIRVANISEVMSILARFYAHLMKRCSSTTCPEQAYREEACQLAEKCYPGGLKAAVAAAATGLDGGLPHVLDVFTRCVLNMQADLYFQKQCERWGLAYEFNTRLAIASEYLERYGEALFGPHVPPPAQLAVMCEAVLRDHLAFMERNRLRL